MNKFWIYVLLIILSNNCIASDHIDGPITAAHRAGDITDFYVFPTPKNKSELAIIVNSHPLISKHGHFQDQQTFRITIKQAQISQDTFKLSFADELVILCASKTENPHQHVHDQTIHCRSETGLNLSAKLNASAMTNLEDFPKNTGDIFAGRRLDPFFFNSTWAIKTSSKGTIAKRNKRNDIASTNILSLAIKIKLGDFFNTDTSSIYVAAIESQSSNSLDDNAQRIDRIGRPEITNVLLAVPEGKELRDLYNQTPTFSIDSTNQAQFIERIKNRIHYYDKLDKQTHWTEADIIEAASLLERDYLILDVAKPCEGDNFLEIEKAMMRKEMHASCGGRKLTDDIIDTLYTYFINKDEGPRIGDGVNEASKAPKQAFPYLNRPARGFWPWLKAAIARKIIYR